jgi:hypothetical protein
MLEYIHMSIESYSIIMTKRLKYTNQEYLKLANEEAEKYKSSLFYTCFYVQKNLNKFNHKIHNFP